jgi:hypothetical protein
MSILCAGDYTFDRVPLFDYDMPRALNSAFFTRIGPATCGVRRRVFSASRSDLRQAFAGCTFRTNLEIGPIDCCFRSRFRDLADWGRRRRATPPTDSRPRRLSSRRYSFKRDAGSGSLFRCIERLARRPGGPGKPAGRRNRGCVAQGVELRQRWHGHAAGLAEGHCRQRECGIRAGIPNAARWG